MGYKIRDGIVMETICGTTLLIATLEANKYCPYVMQLNEASAYIWNLLFEGKSIEEIEKRISQDYDLSKDEASKILIDYIEELKEQNYLLNV